MIVQIHSDSSITLEDANTFTAFSVSAASMPLAQVIAAFAGDAYAGGADAREDTGGDAEQNAGGEEHLWITISRLRALGAAHGDPAWNAGCDKMLEYAESKGWVDESRTSVRAHIER